MTKYYLPRITTKPLNEMYTKPQGDELSLTPKSIKAELDKSVIGQDQAKKVLAAAGYNAWVRMYNELGANPVYIKKTNILMLGGTGCGKTFLMQMLGKALHIPVALCDCTTITKTGYVGKDLNSIFSDLLNASLDIVKEEWEYASQANEWGALSDQAVAKAEFGIIYLDEIDKLRVPAVESGRDIAGQSVQEELLRAVEGTTVEVKSNLGTVQDFHTDNILFIGGGAFKDIERHITARLSTKSIGFNAPTQNPAALRSTYMSQVTRDDLLAYGMLGELVGRFHNILALQDLTEDMMVDILKYSSHSIIQSYQNLFDMYDVELLFTEDAFREIGRAAVKLKSGARSLHAILEAILEDAQFNLPSDPQIANLTIDADHVTAILKKRFNI